METIFKLHGKLPEVNISGSINQLNQFHQFQPD